MSTTPLHEALEAAVRAVVWGPVAALALTGCGPSPSEVEAASVRLYGRTGCLDVMQGFVLPCGVPMSVVLAEPIRADVCRDLCVTQPSDVCRLWTFGSSGVGLVCGSSSPIEGRRPPGAVLRRDAPTSDVAVLLQAAVDEARSADAFEQLAEVLMQANAPASLVHRARQAVVEEQHHALTMSRLATRLGEVSSPRIERAVVAALPLETWLFDNAVEGCVNETFAAVLMTLRGAIATDAHARTAFAQIAADERGHAHFSAALHQWALETLPPSTAVALDRARLHALETLCNRLESWSLPQSDALGLPSIADVVALGAALRLALKEERLPRSARQVRSL